jgi:hypothetical protein
MGNSHHHDRPKKRERMVLTRFFCVKCDGQYSGGKVDGHLAANSCIHNSLLLFMLKHSLKVGGQLVSGPATKLADTRPPTSPFGRQSGENWKVMANLLIDREILAG